MSDERTETAQRWVTETAEAIAMRHMISPRTVRGWLSTGKIRPEAAEHLAALSDLGHHPDMLNAAVYALVGDRPIGDLDDITDTRPAGAGEGAER